MISVLDASSNGDDDDDDDDDDGDEDDEEEYDWKTSLTVSVGEIGLSVVAAC